MKRRKARTKPAEAPGPDLPGRLLAIDLGSRLCGWATANVAADGAVLDRESGCLDLESLAGRHRWSRVDTFARWLTLKLNQGVTWLAIEEPHTGRDNVGTRHLMHGLYTLAQLISWRRFGRDARSVSRFDVFGATVGWKLRAVEGQETKRGRKRMRCPTKGEMLAAVNARHGWALTSEDEADAVAMLDMLLPGTCGKSPPQAVERQLIQIPAPTVPEHPPPKAGPVIRPARGRRRAKPPVADGPPNLSCLGTIKA
jgi:hypothetical protein